MSINRRQLVMGGGLLLIGGSGALGREALQIPQGTGPLPAEWITAPSIRLWKGAAPGNPEVAPQPSGTLDPVFITGVANPEMRVFRPAKSNGRAILAIPGGAYTFVSIRNEGTDVARVFNAMGYTVFVLVYRLPGEGWADRANVPLQDAQRAMRLIKSRAGEFGVDATAVSVIGFSAGGHLAASLITSGSEKLYDARDHADQFDPTPCCAALIYPVISAEPPLTHQQSADMLLGPLPSPEAVARRSPARHILPHTPATFLVHALDDEPVPSGNVVLFHDAMRKAGRPVELHLFEEGGHGFGIGPANAPAGLWPQLFAAFMNRHLSVAAKS